jgi:hypothetical protein
LKVQRPEIVDLLHLLADRLAARGLKGEMYVVGAQPSHSPSTRGDRRTTSMPSSSQSRRSTMPQQRLRGSAGSTKAG